MDRFEGGYDPLGDVLELERSAYQAGAFEEASTQGAVAVVSGTGFALQGTLRRPVDIIDEQVLQNVSDGQWELEGLGLAVVGRAGRAGVVAGSGAGFEDVATGTGYVVGMLAVDGDWKLAVVQLGAEAEVALCGSGSYEECRGMARQVMGRFGRDGVEGGLRAAQSCLMTLPELDVSL